MRYFLPYVETLLSILDQARMVYAHCISRCHRGWMDGHTTTDTQKILGPRKIFLLETTDPAVKKWSTLGAHFIKTHEKSANE